MASADRVLRDTKANRWRWVIHSPLIKKSHQKKHVKKYTLQPELRSLINVLES